MANKINFYKKLEIGMLQKGYNKIIQTIKEGKSLTDRGEFSMLN